MIERRKHNTHNVEEQQWLIKVRITFGVLDDLGLDHMTSDLKLNVGWCYTRQLELLHVSYTPAHHLQKQSHSVTQSKCIMHTCDGTHKSFIFLNFLQWLPPNVMISTLLFLWYVCQVEYRQNYFIENHLSKLKHEHVELWYSIARHFLDHVS